MAAVSREEYSGSVSQSYSALLVLLRTPNAVFRTAAEISAKLTYEGNIKKPMELRQLGKLLSCHSFMPLKTTGGKRGYFVIERSNGQEYTKDIIRELENS